MAQTIYGVNHALAVTQWSKRLLHEAMWKTIANRFIGEDSDSLCQVKTELSKEAGSKLTFGLGLQLTGLGVIGDNTLKGQEEAMLDATQSLYIDQLRHATNVTGSVSQQRVPFSVRAEGMSRLRDWYARKIDVGFFAHLASNSAQTDTRVTALNATTAPTATRWVYGGGVSAESSLIAAAQRFTLDMIDDAVAKAETLTPPIRKINMGEGMACYVAFLHPFQVHDLKTNMSPGQWADIQKAALQGGMITKNPIFTGALGMHNQTVLYSSSYLPFGDSTQMGSRELTHLGAAAAGTTNVARGAFCGAQAAMMGFGRGYNSDLQMKWVEVLDDYENQLNIGVALTWGAVKTRFTLSGTATDLATIALSSYSPGP